MSRICRDRPRPRRRHRPRPLSGHGRRGAPPRPLFDRAPTDPPVAGGMRLQPRTDPHRDLDLCALRGVTDGIREVAERGRHPDVVATPATWCPSLPRAPCVRCVCPAWVDEYRGRPPGAGHSVGQRRCPWALQAGRRRRSPRCPIRCAPSPETATAETGRGPRRPVSALPYRHRFASPLRGRPRLLFLGTGDRNDWRPVWRRYPPRWSCSRSPCRPVTTSP